MFLQQAKLYRYEGNQKNELGTFQFNILSIRKGTNLVNGEERPQEIMKIATNIELNLYDVIEFNSKQYSVSNIEIRQKAFEKQCIAEMVTNG